MKAIDCAFRALRGVGQRGTDRIEVTERAVHVRRRLTPREELMTGPEVDIRGTSEVEERKNRALPNMNEVGRRLIEEELAS